LAAGITDEHESRDTVWQHEWALDGVNGGRLVMPKFLLQIVDSQDRRRAVTLPAGGELERELIKSCTEAIVQKGVGMFRTEAHVRTAIRDGLTETIRDLKWQTVYLV
jgi:hypothetical protein